MPHPLERKTLHLCSKVPSNYSTKIQGMFYVTENSQGVEELKQFLTIKMALLEAQLSEVTNILLCP